MRQASETPLNEPPEPAAARSRVEIVPAPCPVSAGGDEGACPSDGSGPRARLVGPYRLLERIGEGAMGEVYRAEHAQLGRRVALKLLRPELAARHDCAQRLFAEARAANLVRSDHVVEVTDLCFEPSGETFLVMELLEGVDLARARDEGRLDLHSILGVMRQLAETLTRVHECGIVHRDLKPENVFLTDRDGEPFVKLIDFGVAKLDERGAGRPTNTTSPGMIVGTPHYMAPEQAAADPVDAACDIYAVGVMLYELLTGRRPYQAVALRELLMEIVATSPPPVSAHVTLPDSIAARADALLAACLQKEARHRPAAPQLLEDIDALLASLREEGRTRVPCFSAEPASLPGGECAPKRARSSVRATRPRVRRARRSAMGRLAPYWAAAALGLSMSALAGYWHYEQPAHVESTHAQPLSVPADPTPHPEKTASAPTAAAPSLQSPVVVSSLGTEATHVGEAGRQGEPAAGESVAAEASEAQATAGDSTSEGEDEPSAAHERGMREDDERVEREREHRRAARRDERRAAPQERTGDEGSDRDSHRRHRRHEGARERAPNHVPTLSFRSDADRRDAVMDPFTEPSK